ncbi:MAG: Beta-hexosaminidase [Marinimicrobia bacterium 46_47]|nr:MAG: Beta-hexosaminidase [Marinimicrobia bacterium 46_47]HBY18518.1 beta-hexosaminidase [Candidatus Neomarinimicrobiota bacterium]
MIHSKNKRVVLFLFILLWSGSLAGMQTLEREHTLMPVPKEILWESGIFRLDDTFRINVAGEAGERTFKAATRALRRLSGRTGLFFDQDYITGINQSPEAGLELMCYRTGELKLGEDESYRLRVSSREMIIEAETELGLMHGLETWLQLLESDDEGYFFPAVIIKDEPRFPWRGLMIDVCRHFQPLHVILQNIDAMAAVKMNVLHLHLSDDQGFRMESKAYPLLHQKGSDGLYFTQCQIREIVDYAAERGIRVVPEFDMPSHSTAWFVGYPELSSKDTTYTIERSWGVKDPGMNPASEFTYAFLDTFIAEMTTLFPDPYFHIGGDENNGKWWKENPDIVAFMDSMGFETTHELQTYFVQRVYNIVRKHNRIMAGWGEIYDPEMPRDVLIHFWWPRMKEMEEALLNGFKGIVSNGYYVDHFRTAEYHYLMDPIRPEYVTDTLAARNILGGEAASWAEFVTEELTGLRIWPRTAAIAERFWSPAHIRDVEDMYRRLEKTSLRLEEIGLDHLKNRDMMLRRLAGQRDIAALHVLTGTVEPLEHYSRHRAVERKKYVQHAPLTRLVDAAWSDAPDARNFRFLVRDYLKEPSIEKEKQIREILYRWAENHKKLAPVIDANPILWEIRGLSEDLSRSAQIGLKVLEKKDSWFGPSSKDINQYVRELEKMKAPRGELTLEHLDALIQLVENV